MNKKDIKFLVETLNQLFPNAKTELYYNSEFQLLIAILMSAQTTDKQVNKVNKIFFEYLKESSDAEILWLEKIKEFIKSISFFNNKAKYILKTSQIISKKYNWIPPNNIKNLLELPWIWIKTSKVYLAIVYNAPYIWVDTHVHRVLNRLWIIKTKTPIETDKKISNYFTKENHTMLHNTLVLFWRYYCSSKNPKCRECPFLEKCIYKNNKKI